MGLFDSLCCESGLIIANTSRGEKEIKLQRLIVIREVAEGGWAPIALPIAGTNDRGGTMDMPSKLDANMKAVSAFGSTLTYANARTKEVKKDLAKGLERTLNEIRGDGGGATLGAQQISFSLIDGGIYEAIVAQVRTSSATAWTRFAQVSLGAPELSLPRRPKTKLKRIKVPPAIKKLADALIEDPSDEATRRVFVDAVLEHDEPRGRLLAALPRVGKLSWDALAALAFPAGTSIYQGSDTQALRPALVDLVRFLAWGTVLAPAHGEGQVTHYTQENRDDDGAAEPYVVRARKKYAGMPELLSVCDLNERAFRDRGEI